MLSRLRAAPLDWASPAGALAAAVGPDVRRAPPTLRFHHLHYRVSDPGAALGDAADAFKGTRDDPPGARASACGWDRQYVLFERVGREQPFEPRPEARRRLRRSRPVAGREGRPASSRPSLAETAVARRFRTRRSITSPSPPTISGPVVAALARDAGLGQRRPGVVSGCRPGSSSRSCATPTGRTRTGVRCILDVRSPGRGEVPASAPWRSCPSRRLASASTSSTSRSCLEPVAARPASRLPCAIRTPAIRSPHFIDVHERPFHLFILSRDLAQFAHVHPEPTSRTASSSCGTTSPPASTC